MLTAVGDRAGGEKGRFVCSLEKFLPNSFLHYPFSVEVLAMPHSRNSCISSSFKKAEESLLSLGPPEMLTQYH